MADKKPDPNAPKPNNKMVVIAGAMIVISLAWFVYAINPGGALRAWTKEEKKAIADHKIHEAEVARDEKRKKEWEARLKASQKK